jgi:hypothetical protein
LRQNRVTPYEVKKFSFFDRFTLTRKLELFIKFAPFRIKEVASKIFQKSRGWHSKASCWSIQPAAFGGIIQLVDITALRL